MRGKLAGSLGVGLGLLVGAARAEEVTWRPAGSRPAGQATPAVSLGRPVALPDRAAAAPIHSVSFRPAIYRGQSPEPPRAMPVPPYPGQPGLADDDRFRRMPRAENGDGKMRVPGGAEPLPPPQRRIEPVPPAAVPTPAPFLGPVAVDPVVEEGAPAAPGEGGGGVPYVEKWGWGRLFCCSDLCEDNSTFYLRGEYLLWWLKGYNVPALVTTSPAGTPREQAGVLPAATVLFGNDRINMEEFSGGRFTFGLWLDKTDQVGLETSGFFLGRRASAFNAASADGSTILARPFFDINPLNPTFGRAGGESAQLVAFPGTLGGNVAVRSVTDLWGVEQNLRLNLWRECGHRMDFLVGFRYAQLNESLGINENLTTLSDITFRPTTGVDTTIPAGTTILVGDRFTTSNQFYGGQIGAEIDLRHGRWSLDLIGKLGLGSVRQVVRIDGATTFNLGDVSVTQPGGLLAQGTNIGRYSRNEFAILPELGVRLGFQVTQHMRLFAGYSVLYISDVVRPGNQIDRTVNTSQLPNLPAQGLLTGPVRPAFDFRNTDFWAHGVSFGLEFKY